MECDTPPICPSRARAQSPEPHIPQAIQTQQNLSEDDDLVWSDEDDKGPKVNINRTTWFATDMDADRARGHPVLHSLPAAAGRVVHLFGVMNPLGVAYACQ